MDEIQALIFDRTQEDIKNLTAKAYISDDDLNRIEQAVHTISHYLNRYGYRNKVQCRLWDRGDRRTDAEMRRLRDNIVELRRAYYTPSDTPLTPDNITYTSIYQANAIEKILYDLGKAVEAAVPGNHHLAFKIGMRPIGNRSEP